MEGKILILLLVVVFSVGCCQAAWNIWGCFGSDCTKPAQQRQQQVAKVPTNTGTFHTSVRKDLLAEYDDQAEEHWPPPEFGGERFSSRSNQQPVIEERRVFAGERKPVIRRGGSKYLSGLRLLFHEYEEGEPTTFEERQALYESKFKELMASKQRPVIKRGGSEYLEGLSSLFPGEEEEERPATSQQGHSSDESRPVELAAKEQKPVIKRGGSGYLDGVGQLFSEEDEEPIRQERNSFYGDDGKLDKLVADNKDDAQSTVHPNVPPNSVAKEPVPQKEYRYDYFGLKGLFQVDEDE